MASDNTKICYFCFLLLNDDNLVNYPENSWKRLLRIIFPKLGLDIPGQPLICEDCNNKLEKYSLFKQRCLDTENRINSYKEHHKCKTVSLQEICMEERKDCNIILDFAVCRLCCQCIEGDGIVCLSSHYAVIIGHIVPEMDLDLIKKPVMCKNCEECLNKIESIYNKCCSNGNIQNTSVKCKNNNNEHIDLKLKYEILGSDCDESSSQSGGVSINDKEPSMSQVESVQNESNIEIFNCSHCNYKTKSNFSLRRHVWLKHEKKVTSTKTGTRTTTKQKSLQNEITNSEQNNCSQTEEDPSSFGSNDCQDGYSRPELKCEWVEECDDDMLEEELEAPFVDDQELPNLSDITETDNIINVKSEDFTSSFIFDPNNSSNVNFVDTWSNYSPLFKRNKATNLFYCPRCTYSSKWQQDFKRHFLINHDKNYVPFQCNDCGYKTKRKTQLTRHMNTEHNENFKPYVCTECSYKTKWQTSLRRHIRMEHDENAEVFKCTDCSYSTKQRSSLHLHIKANHKENRVIYECPECLFKSKSEGYFKYHIRTHKVTEVEFECPHCEFKTKWRQYLTRHIRLKHGTDHRTYECAECDYKTNLRGSMVQHIRNIHRKKPFKCEHCGYKTKCKSIFERHVKIKHERDVLTFNCTLCKFKTDRHKSLSRHIETRHNRPPELFECTICNQKLKTKQSLKEHTNMVHATKIEMVKCEYCDFKTKWKKGLERHFRLKHDKDCKKYKCEFCDYEAKLTSNLKLHINSKHNDCRVVYQCDYCETKTVSEVYLKRHVRIEHSDICAIKMEEV